jgi:hypothetical protein
MFHPFASWLGCVCVYAQHVFAAYIAYLHRFVCFLYRALLLMRAFVFVPPSPLPAFKPLYLPRASQLSPLLVVCVCACFGAGCFMWKCRLFPHPRSARWAIAFGVCVCVCVYVFGCLLSFNCSRFYRKFTSNKHTHTQVVLGSAVSLCLGLNS